MCLQCVCLCVHSDNIDSGGGIMHDCVCTSTQSLQLDMEKTLKIEAGIELPMVTG